MGAVLREQNALPYEAFISTFSWAKDDVDNVGAGRAAKGTIPVFIYMQVHARNTANVKPFLFRNYPVFQRSAQRADTCRPHQKATHLACKQIKYLRFFLCQKTHLHLKIKYYPKRSILFCKVQLFFIAIAYCNNFGALIF